MGVLYEEALQYEYGTALTAQGALVTDSGLKKGRSPKDKRIVDEESSVNDIWVDWAGFVIVGSGQHQAARECIHGESRKSHCLLEHPQSPVCV